MEAAEITAESITDSAAAILEEGGHKEESNTEVWLAGDAVLARGGGIAADGHQGSSPQILSEDSPVTTMAVDFVDPQVWAPDVAHN